MKTVSMEKYRRKTKQESMVLMALFYLSLAFMVQQVSTVLGWVTAGHVGVELFGLVALAYIVYFTGMSIKDARLNEGNKNA